MINLKCHKCKLCKTRHNVVVGRGDFLPCSMLFIGEAPGASEDLLGKAFIGASGKLLDKMIAAAKIEETCFFTNTVLCRPVDRNGENRKPMSDEIDACHDYVVEIINEASPEYIIFVGDVATKTFRKEVYDSEIPYAQIIHPAAVLREGGESSTSFFHNVRMLEDALTILSVRRSILRPDLENKIERKSIHGY